MRPLVILFDIDGVLADFAWGLTSLAHGEFGISPRTSEQVQTWNLSDIMLRESFDYLLNQIKGSEWARDFWLNLPLAPNVSPEDLGRISWMTLQYQVYFVTSRIESGNTMQQTHDWLRTYGIAKPNVVMTKRKGEFARIVGADYAIDDKWENAHCVHWISDNPQTKSYLINRPYNQLTNKMGVERVIRIDIIKQFLDDIEKGERTCLQSFQKQ